MASVGSCIGDGLSTDAGLPKVARVEAGTKEGTSGNLSTEPSLPKRVGLGTEEGAIVGNVGLLSTEPSLPRRVGLAADEGNGFLSTEPSLPGRVGLGAGDMEGAVGGLSTVAGFPKVSEIGLGAVVGTLDRLSTKAGFPATACFRLGALEYSRFIGTQVGLVVGLNVGESPDSWTGLSLLPSGDSGQIGGCVGSSETCVLGSLDGGAGGLSTDAGFPTPRLGAEVGTLGRLSTEAGFPNSPCVGLGAEESPRFAGTHVGLVVGLNVGEFPGSWTGLSLFPSGDSGQIGGCVGSSEPAGFLGTGNILEGTGVGPLLVGITILVVLGCLVGALSNDAGFSNLEDGWILWIPVGSSVLGGLLDTDDSVLPI